MYIWHVHYNILYIYTLTARAHTKFVKYWQAQRTPGTSVINGPLDACKYDSYILTVVYAMCVRTHDLLVSVWLCAHYAPCRAERQTLILIHRRGSTSRVQTVAAAAAVTTTTTTVIISYYIILCVPTCNV